MSASSELDTVDVVTRIEPEGAIVVDGGYRAVDMADACTISISILSPVRSLPELLCSALPLLSRDRRCLHTGRNAAIGCKASASEA